MNVYKLMKFDPIANTVVLDFSDEATFTPNVIAIFAPNVDGSIPQQAISDFLHPVKQSTTITTVSL